MAVCAIWSAAIFSAYVAATGCAGRERPVVESWVELGLLGDLRSLAAVEMRFSGFRGEPQTHWLLLDDHILGFARQSGQSRRSFLSFSLD